ncbi:CPBP family intramembrane glutamic endopeptidase [Clostridium oceanicum]|uniref:CPBP family intramembrane metalloprotease n=1 Tax=Clostridium oceanicum TaxID=1543 RepID=A0ABN1JKB9_9CLOT
MNSEIEVNKGKFKLSILGAFSLAILCYCVLREFISIPFYVLSDRVISDKILKSIVYGLGHSIPDVIIIILTLKKIRKEYNQNFKISYIEKFDFKLLICAILSTIGLYLCIENSIGPVLANLPVPKFIEEGFKDLASNVFWGAILVFIFGPIVEEITMRGIILEGLLNKYKPVVSIIVSAVIFGLIHMNLPQGINAMIGGILYGYIYYKTRSLALCIVCHMVNNIIVLFSFSSSIITLFIGLVMLVTAIVFFERCLKKMNHGDVNLKKNIA